METPYENNCSQGLAHARKDLFKSGRLSTNMNLAPYRALISYCLCMFQLCVCIESTPLKSQSLENREIRVSRKVYRCKPVRK